MDANILLWGGFNLFVLLMLALDLGVFHRKAHAVTMKEALIWSGVWISLSLLFNYGIYVYMGKEKALEFLTGYLIEKSLSVDNIFVFVLIFAYFHVPPAYQHKVLFWGIIGALVMRVIFIFAGVALLSKFHWLIYLFGGFLVITGIRMAVEGEKKIEPERNPVVKLFRRLFPVTDTFHDDRFFLKINGKTLFTPLFIVLLVVEMSDIIFAIDSIPAILAITDDTFI
ncbi:MAG TPA: TerC/Alx family metal homeostasis membrane protein, partial [Chitinophagales bacterium]|nr:TerC/Alx family metal homeostasis membrane protein [Chitinophagales bacterium]